MRSKSVTSVTNGAAVGGDRTTDIMATTVTGRGITPLATMVRVSTVDTVAGIVDGATAGSYRRRERLA
jgi:hypothetical protein